MADAPRKNLARKKPAGASKAKPGGGSHDAKRGSALPLVPERDLPGMVVYQVNLRAFSASGDLSGATAKLDLLSALSVDVVWLMPIYPIGEVGKKGVMGSPYSIRDFVSVNPELGTSADLDAFVSEAHGRGMRVILDWVTNHTSWDHAWLGNAGWHTTDASGQVQVPKGTDWTDAAELDYGQPEVGVAMVEAMRFWVERHGVDGFRCDVADLVPVAFWESAIRPLEESVGRDLLFLAEGDRASNFGAGFDLAYDWPVYKQLKRIYCQGESAERLLAAHREVYASFGLGAEQQMMRFTTNHDESAWDEPPTTIFNGASGAYAAFAAAASLGGALLVYTGQEAGWPDKVPFFERAPIDASYGLAERRRYEALLSARRGSAALGGVSFGDDFSTYDVAAFERLGPGGSGERVLAVVNLRPDDKTLALPASWRGVAARELVTGTRLVLGDALRLEPYAVRWWLAEG